MAEKTPAGSSDSTKGSSALDREADRVEQMSQGKDGEAGRKAEEGENGVNTPTQVDQDNRVDKARADARAAGGGPDAPEAGLNQDG